MLRPHHLQLRIGFVLAQFCPRIPQRWKAGQTVEEAEEISYDVIFSCILSVWQLNEC